ncbi:MAG: transcriptional repressor [Gammaproteobacteria bacterium]|jgi:Fe2+/Zn2+ uptake regulation proteins|nr:transcriptional repressor [Gammaproteobacteria bacterium]
MKKHKSHSRVLMPFKENGHSHKKCLDSALITAEKTCLARGVRLTRLRRRVLELVWGSHEPVKAYDILDKLRDEHSGSAPPTVYRALDFLRAEGMVHKIESLTAYVGCGEPEHRHIGQFLICRACGAVAEMDDAEVRELLAEKADTLGFHIDREMIEIKGLCAACLTENI